VSGNTQHQLLICQPSDIALWQAALKNYLLLESDEELVVTTELEQAETWLQTNAPVCIFLDISRTDGKGLALIHHLATLEQTIIALVRGGTVKELHSQALAMGAIEVLAYEEITARPVQRLLLNAAERQRLQWEVLAANTALRASEARFNDIAERIDQGLWVRTADGTQCLYINKAFETIWGRSLEDMNALHWRDTVHPDDRLLAHESYMKHQRDSADYSLTYRILRPDGECRWIENRAFAVRDEAGQLLRMSGIARDITQQLQIEQDLRLSQKLESLGQLSAGIAHEINTPCQYISDNLVFLQDSFLGLQPVLESVRGLLELAGAAGVETSEQKMLFKNADVEFLLEEIPAALQQSQSGMQQIKKIVQAMKRFSHPGNEKVYTDLNETIANTVTVARNEWKYVAEVELQFEAAMPQVYCLPSAINQVILNIVVNAAHAIADVVKDGELGKIIISTRVVNNMAEIMLRDSGSGIPDHVKAKIFDPFFTTKQVGKGTGQGLAIAHKVICEDHKGTIKVDSVVGESTTFTILIPVHSQEIKQQAAA
jgi:two-component system, NtrC family, sensor kinase